MRLIRSLGYALSGINNCLRNGRNFRIQICIALLTISAGFCFTITLQEWIVVLVCTAIVLSLEMINTSIEKFADHVCSSIQPDIKIVKDIAAGAVLISCIISFIAGVMIFVPKIKMAFS